LETVVDAPIQTCFDLSRSIDVHMRSTAQTKERAVAGVMSGLIGLNETVTWEAVHLGVKWKLTSKITAFDPPYFFVDEMVEGPFTRIYHEHHFEEQANGTKMIDSFDFTSPLGVLGKMADRLFLEAYMRKFLLIRNEYLKDMAEAEKIILK
jgi:ligand-binding SRPBCC domain-containing protein